MFQYYQNQFCKSSIIYYRNCIKKGCHKNYFLKYSLVNVHGLNPKYFQNMFKSSHRRYSVRKGVIRNFTKFSGKHLCQRSEACNFIKKETLAWVFSCEFFLISKNIFSYRAPPVVTSEKPVTMQFLRIILTECNLVSHWIQCFFRQLIDTQKVLLILIKIGLG